MTQMPSYIYIFFKISNPAAPTVYGQNWHPAKSGVPFSSPASKLPSRKLFEELNGFSHSNISSSKNSTASHTQTYFSLRTATSIMFQSHANVLIRSELYVILEAVADHVKMHHKIREQRDNWNILLLNSINMITLTASTMGGVADAANGVPLLAFTLSSGLLFSAAMGILVIMNKILPL